MRSTGSQSRAASCCDVSPRDALTVFALKLVLAPAFVLLTSLVARRFGATVAGIVGGLPGIAAPILLVVALQHGTAFAAAAASGTLLGSVALVGFLVAYAGTSRRRAWPAALLAGFAAFFVLVALLRPLHVAAPTALALALPAILAALLVLPRARTARDGEDVYPRFDLPLRAIAAAVPVVVLTAAARALGPHLTGLLSAFPIMTPVLAAFTHARRGPEEAVTFLRGMTAGLVAYALFCFLLALLLDRVGLAAAFVFATAAALGLQAALIAIRRIATLRRSPPARAVRRWRRCAEPPRGQEGGSARATDADGSAEGFTAVYVPGESQCATCRS